ncbi:MAG: ATP-binding protein [Pseudomonadota bacterium]|nr:ATP-binding protein [Pseudomonadota bacterium]
MATYNILLIAPNPYQARQLQELLPQPRFKCSHRVYLDASQLSDYDLVLLNLPVKALNTLVTTLDTQYIPVIALLTEDNPTLALELLQHGLQDCLPLSQLSSERLTQAIEYALQRHRLRQQHMQALRTHEQRLQAMIARSPDAILLINKEGQILFANPAAEALFKRSAEELIHEVVGFPIVTEELTEIEIIRQGGKVAYAEMRLVEWQAEGVYLAWLHNTTKRKHAEAALLAGQALLEQRIEERTLELTRAHRLKDEFLANMSHELRTPLNIILGIASSLKEQVYGSLNNQQINVLNTLEDSIQHLLTLINDILTFAHLQANQLTLHPQATSIEQVCQNVLAKIQKMAQKKRLKVAFSLDTAVDYLYIDECRLKQILTHLLANAIKFTPEGGSIGLEVTLTPEQKKMCFSIWDSGIGIEEKDKIYIFEPFIQLDGGLDRQQEGTGIGLALVSRLVELYGGEITLESNVNQGSRFSVSLPWQPVDKKAYWAQQTDRDPQFTLSSEAQSVPECSEFTMETLSDYLVNKED